MTILLTLSRRGNFVQLDDAIIRLEGKAVLVRFLGTFFEMDGLLLGAVVLSIADGLLNTGVDATLGVAFVISVA
jgi:hypothetical protein